MQKVDTGKIYAMKSLKKAEMFKKDQVRLAPPASSVITAKTLTTARPRTR